MEHQTAKYTIPPSVPQVDYTGATLVRSPKVTADGSVTYNHDIGPGKLRVTAAEFYADGYNNDYEGAPAGLATQGGRACRRA
ncbi:hypothetical protein [Phenylobacterium sp.]|jgi:hypothetical protein|uniref:hypothetical protein n=1 Tax=Phenylobacterium sp. TaxID=1871053 RepID=UPI002E357076|nr:hypothetical protein [Phenylobacterium sp.]